MGPRQALCYVTKDTVRMEGSKSMEGISTGDGTDESSAKLGCKEA